MSHLSHIPYLSSEAQVWWNSFAADRGICGSSSSDREDRGRGHLSVLAATATGPPAEPGHCPVEPGQWLGWPAAISAQLPRWQPR